MEDEGWILESFLPLLSSFLVQIPVFYVGLFSVGFLNYVR